MEKILKLIKSPCGDDLEIGIRLLLSLSLKEIEFFFKTYNEKPSEFMEIPTKCSNKGPFYYVDLGEDYFFIHFHIWLRLKKKPAHINSLLPIVKLKEYLYGEDI